MRISVPIYRIRLAKFRYRTIGIAQRRVTPINFLLCSGSLPLRSSCGRQNYIFTPLSTLCSTQALSAASPASSWNTAHTSAYRAHWPPRISCSGCSSACSVVIHSTSLLKHRCGTPIMSRIAARNCPFLLATYAAGWGGLPPAPGPNSPRQSSALGRKPEHASSITSTLASLQCSLPCLLLSLHSARAASYDRNLYLPALLLLDSSRMALRRMHPRPAREETPTLHKSPARPQRLPQRLSLPWPAPRAPINTPWPPLLLARHCRVERHSSRAGSERACPRPRHPRG
jgi:hypothetical protein